ncbi:MAG TPA: cytochrome P450 [Chloroflexota bacterium]|nr:cytochrome P450 [Chloroflexota bacterium]
MPAPDGSAAGSHSADLDIHDPAFARDPYPHYDQLRQRCPVARGEKYGGYWLLTRYGDVREAARDWRTFTSSVPGVTSIPAAARRTEPQLPLEVDPPLHSRYRALVNPVFSPLRIERLRPRVEALASRLVDDLLPHLARGETVDLVSAYAEPLSIGALAAFTGLPREDGALWLDWQRRMFDVRHPDDGLRATHEMNAYIVRLVDQRKRSPHPDDFISLLLQSEVDGHHLTDKEVHAFCQLQFGAGFETTADAMSITLHYLAQHPQTRAQLAETPDLHQPAVEEFLRYATPIQIFGRNATRDLELHGQAVKSGDVVALSYGSANHDPTVFDAPETCRLDRFAAPTAPRHLTFGAGVHLCLGAPLARLELATTLREFTTRVPPLSLPVDAEVVWKSRGDRRGISSLPVRQALG